MTLNKLLLVIAPVGLMMAVCLGLTGSGNLVGAVRQFA
jgi:hypothetical protein